MQLLVLDGSKKTNRSEAGALETHGGQLRGVKMCVT